MLLLDTPTPPRLDHSTALRQRLAIALPIAIFAVLSFYCAIRSEGFISGDACIHYFAARYAFANPRNFVDIWSRPLVTTLDALPAYFGGRMGIRFTSMLLAIGCGIVAWRIAKGQGLRMPTLALLFTLGQPMLFLHSFSEMTELPFALLLGLAFWAWQSEKYWLSAILVAWTPLARPEGFGIVAIWSVLLALKYKWRPMLALPVPIALWNIAGWLLSDRTSPWWRWLPDNWPYAGRSMYSSGHLLAFVAMLPVVVSPLALPAVLLGMWRSATDANRLEGKSAASKHLRLCRILTAALPLFVLLTHSLLYWLGRMASAGEARYLLVAAPFWGILAARGWEWAFAQLRWRHAFGWASAAVLFPLAVNFVKPAAPVPFWHDWESARTLAAWYRTNPIRLTHPRIMTTHPGIYYFLDVNPYRSPGMHAWDKQSVRDRPNDTLLIWDPIFASKNACAELAIALDDIRRAGWVEINVPKLREEPDPGALGDPGDRSWHVFVAK